MAGIAELKSMENQEAGREDEKTLATKRKSFQLSACAHRPVARPTVRKLSQLRQGSTELISAGLPSEAVVHKLGATKLVIGIDIETADWVDRENRTTKGQFGFYNLCHPEDFNQRIIQIGWAIGATEEGASVESHEYLVRPEGFLISTKAMRKHGITNELVEKEGLPLKNAMTIFMQSVADAYELGGRVVIHHLEFDAGIIDKELANAGLDHWRSKWSTIARHGLCTMDPDIGTWVQKCMGRDCGPEDNKPVLALRDAVRFLLPDTDTIQHLKTKLHTAGADAQLHRLLYIALRKLCDEANKS